MPNSFSDYANYLQGLILINQMIELVKAKSDSSDQELALQQFITQKSTLLHSKGLSYADIIKEAFIFSIHNDADYAGHLLYKKSNRAIRKFIGKNLFKTEKLYKSEEYIFCKENNPHAKDIQIIIDSQTFEDLKNNKGVSDNIKTIIEAKNSVIFAEWGAKSFIDNNDISTEGDIGFLIHNTIYYTDGNRRYFPNSAVPLNALWKGSFMCLNGPLLKDYADLYKVSVGGKNMPQLLLDNKDIKSIEQIDPEKYKALLERRVLSLLRCFIQQAEKDGFTYKVARIPGLGCGCFSGGYKIKPLFEQTIKKIIAENPDLFKNTVIYYDRFDGENVDNEIDPDLLKNQCYFVNGANMKESKRLAPCAPLSEYNTILEKKQINIKLNSKNTAHGVITATDHVSIIGNEAYNKSFSTDEPAVFVASNAILKTFPESGRFFPYNIKNKEFFVPVINLKPLPISNYLEQTIIVDNNTGLIHRLGELLEDTKNQEEKYDAIKDTEHKPNIPKSASDNTEHPKQISNDNINTKNNSVEKVNATKVASANTKITIPDI